MDRTKNKLATFFNTDDDEQSSFPQKTVDDQKLSQYTQGTVRKSKREKDKEKEEAKKREEEELAAKTYAEFLDAFEGEGATKRGAFVKASGSGAVSESYNPLSGRRGDHGRSDVREEMMRSKSPLIAPAPRPKGKRAMDAFLEEIKRDQAEREARLGRHSNVQGRSVTALAAYEGQSGSKDTGDPLTSNVFVANLPAHVTEMSLGNFFATRCGPVGSVKIMWPRADASVSVGPGADMTVSRVKRAGLSGFVSFMKRKDAEKAVRDVDGFDWGGSILRVGWSKAVPIAPKATYVASRHSKSRSRSPDTSDKRRRETRSYSRDKRDSRSRSRSRDRRHKKHDRPRSYSRSRSRDHRRRSRSRSYDRSRRYSNSRSRSPHRRAHRSHSRSDRYRSDGDSDAESFIRTVAWKVRQHGDKFEDVLLEREKGNPKFNFLFETKSRNYRFYRSLVRDDDSADEFDDEGYNSTYSTDSAEESEKERTRKNQLGRLARRRFEAMLRSLAGHTGDIARCMAFSLEHAEAASEVSDIIVASLLVDGTPVPRKVARLHLICDILHNSAASVPNAWKFRQEFQSRLGIVFDHLSSIYHSFPGRITAETFKKQIMAVVDVWEDWIVFTPDFTSALKSRLEGVVETEKPAEGGDLATKTSSEKMTLPSKFKVSSFKPAGEPVEPEVKAKGPDNAQEDVDMDMDDSDAEKTPAYDDLDGMPMNDDLDGEPISLDPIDGEPLDGELIDGEPIDGETLDGESMDNDIDGVLV